MAPCRTIETGTDDLLARVEDGVAVLTMNRPERRNAMSNPMMAAMAAALREAETSPEVRCVVLTGAGGAFCAGGDVKGMNERNTGGGGGRRATLDEVVDLAVGEAGASRIPVFTIGFDRFGGGSLKSLLNLSRGTNAEAFFAQSPELVASYFDEIWGQMLHSYVVRYPADLDGGHHSIEVTIGSQSDTLSVAYPSLGGGNALWVVSGALVLLIGIGAFYMRRPPSAGRLIFLEGPRKGETVMLGKPQLTIGALADNDIVVPSPAVSRYHAQLQCRGRYVEIKDVGSSNGTFVNGTNVRSCPLEPGDTVRIGDIDLVYER